MVQFDPTLRNINDKPYAMYIMRLDACIVVKHPNTGKPVEMAFGRWLDDPPETEDFPTLYVDEDEENTQASWDVLGGWLEEG